MHRAAGAKEKGVNGVIERVRAMAREAIEQYGRETHAGGEPVYPDWAYDVLAVCHAAERAPAVPPANPNGEGYGVIQDVKQARKAAKQALQAGLRGWFPAACVVLARALDEAERRTAPQAEPSDEHVSVVGMPEFDALLDHIYEYGTASEGIIDRANAFARAIIAQARADLIDEIHERITDRAVAGALLVKDVRNIIPKE